MENGHASAPAVASFAAFMLLAAAPYAARSDWAVGTDAGVRHDITSATRSSRPTSWRIPLSTRGCRRIGYFPLGDGYGLTLGGDLSGESYPQDYGTQ